MVFLSTYPVNRLTVANLANVARWYRCVGYNIGPMWQIVVRCRKFMLAAQHWPYVESSSSQAPSTTIQPHCSPTGNTILQLSPDQIANLGTYRSWFLHSCEADIGYPAGDLSIEIMKSGDLEFRTLMLQLKAHRTTKHHAKFIEK
ncbi:Hypothetical predicted protein [Mytilus galloprovincialis]|uniref:Uncharacterized protein n=1 Tax=Mytilus galloprovincialis TaxID=29158 RepID=A0A8B6G522_MYTGA|nr:Hypothetical predicted protein [Mytilus galloprovincialis]